MSLRLIDNIFDSANFQSLRGVVCSALVGLFLPVFVARQFVYWYHPELCDLDGRKTTREGNATRRQSRYGGATLVSWIHRSSEKEKLGLVFIVHGFGEHCLRYAHVVDALNRAGFDVALMDHQGHGHSGGDRAYVRKWENWRDDYLDFMDRVVADEVAAKKKPRAIFILGHSLGGGLTIEISRSSRVPLTGLVLSAPLIVPDPQLAKPILVKISSFISAWLPKVPLVKLSPNFVSRDPGVVQDYSTDPLVYHGGVRARVGYELLKMMADIVAHSASDKLPFLVLHGDRDRLTMPEGSKLYYENSTVKNKEIRILTGLFHEIMNEPEKEEIISVIIDWMRRNA